MRVRPGAVSAGPLLPDTGLSSTDARIPDPSPVGEWVAWWLLDMMRLPCSAGATDAHAIVKGHTGLAARRRPARVAGLTCRLAVPALAAPLWIGEALSLAVPPGECRRQGRRAGS